MKMNKTLTNNIKYIEIYSQDMVNVVHHQIYQNATLFFNVNY